MYAGATSGLVERRWKLVESFHRCPHDRDRALLSHRCLVSPAFKMASALSRAQNTSLIIRLYIHVNFKNLHQNYHALA